MGPLFESLAVQTIRVPADRHRARTYHLRTQGGDHEVDVIVERPDRRVVAFEVKTPTAVRPHDVRNLVCLKQQEPDLVLDCVVLTMGEAAYRRKDGIIVVPLALLGA